MCMRSRLRQEEGGGGRGGSGVGEGGGGGGVGGGGGIPPIGREERRNSHPQCKAAHLKTLLCLWLTEESFWRLWCSATPHFSRQTAFRQSSNKLSTSVQGCLRTIIVKE